MRDPTRSPRRSGTGPPRPPSGALLGQVVGAALAEIYVFDAATLAIVEMSRGCRVNLGHTVEQLDEMTPFDLMPSLDEDEFEDALDRLCDGREVEIRFEQLHRRRSGSTYVVDVALQLIGDDQRQLVLADVSDITKLRATEHQLRQAQKVDAVAQLTGGVAHDFNNLLQVIIGSLDVLLDGPNPPADHQRPLIATALTAADRGARLTHGLLTFARRQPFETKRIDLGELVKQTEQLLRRGLGDAITIDMVLADDLWITHADVSQLESALVNLVVNARDAMPDGGRVTITTGNVGRDDHIAGSQPTLRPGNYAMLAVTDTGCGMSPAVRDQVFEPFFTTKPVGKGTGLGLAMVHGFCQQAGGQATIESAEGVGTTVAMFLPRISDA